MEETIVKHMHEDLELVKRDVAIIKHILSEEGDLTQEAKKRLEKSRKKAFSEYQKL